MSKTVFEDEFEPTTAIFAEIIKNESGTDTLFQDAKGHYFLLQWFRGIQLGTGLASALYLHASPISEQEAFLFCLPIMEKKQLESRFAHLINEEKSKENENADSNENT